jgi:glyoxylase-like metal-dependent hydrolase (beta-lactamase superfamily II)
MIAGFPPHFNLVNSRPFEYNAYMIFYQIDAGGDRNYAYLIGDTEGGRAALFDPPGDRSMYSQLLEDHNLTVDYVILTHGHSDHTWGAADTVKHTGAKVAAHPSCSYAPDLQVADGDSLPLGSLALKFIHTPGHTEDSMCILCEDKLITGDTLFVGKVGGTGFGEDARQEYDSLHLKLMTLDDTVQVYPGHNYGLAPTSTIGQEKATNPFIRRESFEAFVELKKNWLEYKKEHGIP